QPSFTSDYSRRMKRTAITSMAAGVSLAILLISTILAGVGALKPERAQAQAPTSPTMSQSLLPQTIVVVGEGSIKIEPDIAQVNIGVEIVDPSIQTAASTARETIQQILD